MLQMLFIQKAEGSILQREEEIVVGIETIGITRETVKVELQLVIGALRWHDTTLVELCLDEAGHAVEFLLRAADHDIEVSVHQQFAVNGELVEHSFDVCLGNLVAGVRHTSVTLGLALEFSQELTLLRNLDNLVIDDTVSVGDAGQKRH